MPENILITFESDTSGLQPGVEGLEQLGQVDKELATTFTKTNDALNQRQKLISTNDSTLQKYVQNLLKVEKATAGAFGVKGLQDFEKTVRSSADSMKLLQASVTLARQNMDKFKPNTPEWIQLNDAVKQGEALLKQYAATEEKTGQSEQSYRSQIRETTQALAQRLATGEATISQIYEEAKGAGVLKDAWGDATRAITALSSDTFAFDAISEGVQAATGAMQVFTGVSALAGSENEDLQKTLIKLNAVMAISAGIQQTINAFQKESALSIAANIVWTKAQAAANIVATDTFALLGISVEASGVAFKTLRAILATTGLGALIILIGFVVEKLISFVSASDGAADSAKNFNDEIEQQNKLLDENIKAIDQSTQILIERARRQADAQDKVNLLTKEGIAAKKQLVDSDLALAKAQKNAIDGALQDQLNFFGLTEEAAKNSTKSKYKILRDEIEQRDAADKQIVKLQEQSTDLQVELVLAGEKEKTDAYNKSVEDQKRAAEKAQQNAEKDAEALFQIRQRALQTQADLFKEFSDNPELGTDARLNSLQQFLQAQQALLTLEKEHELSQAGLTANEKLNIIDKYNHDSAKLTQDGIDMRKTIVDQGNAEQVAADQAYYAKLLADQQKAIDTMGKSVDDQFAKIRQNNQKDQLDRLQQVENEYKAGTISLEQFLQQRENINKEFQQRDLNNQIAAIEAKISNLKLSGLAVPAELQQQLNDLLKQKYDEDAQNFATAEQKKTEEAQKQADKRQKIEDAALSIVSNIFQVFANQRSAVYDKEIERVQALKDAKVISEQEAANRISAIRREEARKQKSAALFSATLSKFQAIASTLAQKDVPFFVKLLEVAAIIAEIASQISGINSTQPQGLFRGTKKAKQGFYRVGELGMELMWHKDTGFQKLGQRGEEKRFIPEGAQVFTHVETQKILEKQMSIPDMNDLPEWAVTQIHNSSTEIDYDKLGEAVAKHIGRISDIPQTGFNWDEDGITRWQKKQNKLEIYLNKYRFNKS